jgi:AraC-like DNA-binding protein
MDLLTLPSVSPLVAENAGLFVSPGVGAHPDRSIRSHELIFVRHGTLALAEDDVDVTASAGQTLLLWPGRRHWGTGPYRRGLSFYWVHFRLAGRTASKGARGDVLRIPQRATPARPDRLAELFHRFIDDQEAGRLTPRAASLLVQLMLAEAATEEDPAPPSAAAVLAARVEAYVVAHLHEPVSTSRVARALELNPDYLNRAFHKVRGVTLTEFVHRRRVGEARALLRESPLNLKQIAHRCGFPNAGYFRRVFKRHAGVTPTAFRRLYARVHINVR